MMRVLRKIKDMAKDRRGYSLVELLVSFAILAVVSVAVMGLMSTGMRLFRTSSSTIGLQYEYQVVMTQVKEYITDCNAGIAWDNTNKALYIVNAKVNDVGASVGFTTHVFKYDGSADVLGYYRAETTGAPPPAVDLTSTSFMPVSERVRVFEVGLSSSSVAVEMEFYNTTREYRASQNITMRNRVIMESSYADLCDKLS